MASPTQKLENLVTLAREPSSEKRRALLEQVTDLFLDDEAGLGNREQDLATDILSRVATQVEEDARVQLSGRLAGFEQAPHRLMRQLAEDVIEVARPILLQSGVLTEQDLVELVEKSGREHQLAISQRETVSSAISDALVQHGDDEVLESLVSNEGAEISYGTMERIVARSEKVERLQRPLLARGDLPADLMHEMFWWVSAALKRHILTKVQVNEAAIDLALKQAEAELAIAQAAEDAQMSKVEEEVRRMAKIGKLNQDGLVQLLRQGSLPHFVAAFAMMTDIDLKTAQRIIFKGGHEAIAVACRASSFDLSTFSAIVLLIDRSGKIGATQRSSAEVANLLDLFNKVPPDTAKRAMRFWRVRRQARQAVVSGAAA